MQTASNWVAAFLRRSKGEPILLVLLFEREFSSTPAPPIGRDNRRNGILARIEYYDVASIQATDMVKEYLSPDQDQGSGIRSGIKLYCMFGLPEEKSFIEYGPEELTGMLRSQ